MSFPFESLSGSGRELGLVVAVLIGIALGFVFERVGFGRAQKLAAQFYGTDMTVFKVMFAAIVTAMLGAVTLSGLGLIDLRALSDAAASNTYLWPMMAGGFALGVGFIVSGYCPGTSLVATASGKIDGLVTVVGVIAGTLLYSELQPYLGGFHDSGDLGHLYLYDLVHLPPAVVAFAVAAMAVAMFFGAEKIEKLAAGKDAEALPTRPRNMVFAGVGMAAALGLATLLLPSIAAPPAPKLATLTTTDLTRLVIDEPWRVRVVDVRSAEDCGKARIPGSECVPQSTLASLQLQDAPATRDLVLVAAGDLAELPSAAHGYRGRVYALAGGFESWARFALLPPAPLAATASPDERDLFRLRAGLQAALTGVPQAPPPPAPVPGAAPAKKKGGGGCGS